MYVWTLTLRFFSLKDYHSYYWGYLGMMKKIHTHTHRPSTFDNSWTSVWAGLCKI